jgi:hypothetical protein
MAWIVAGAGAVILVGVIVAVVLVARRSRAAIPPV